VIRSQSTSGALFSTWISVPNTRGAQRYRGLVLEPRSGSTVAMGIAQYNRPSDATYAAQQLAREVQS